MTRSFMLPDLGEGVHEAEILALPVAVGQQIAEGDIIIEVETDKAAVAIPSPLSGTVTNHHVAVGDLVQVGSPLVSVEEGSAEKATHPSPRAEKSRPEQSEKPAAADRPKESRVVPAAPSTRRLARELGVRLDDVVATGPAGLVTADDVRCCAVGGSAKEESAEESRLQGPEAPERTPPPSKGRAGTRLGEVERVAFRSLRRATARQMASSWSQIPHVSCQDQVDITELEALRQKHKDALAEEGGRLTLTVFVLKALCSALKQYPAFNAELDLEQQQIILKHFYHIGVAVDTEHGLVVPVIRHVDRKSIRELALELHQKVQRARQRQLSREELLGGTFTVTNAGALGGATFSPIINHPQVAILGMGRGRLQPTVVEGAEGECHIVPRLQMPIVLSFDHRVVDGADGIRFLQRIIDALADPDELLLMI